MYGEETRFPTEKKYSCLLVFVLNFSFRSLSWAHSGTGGGFLCWEWGLLWTELYPVFCLVVWLFCEGPLLPSLQKGWRSFWCNLVWRAPPQWRAERNWREGPTLECQSVHSYCGEVAKWSPRPSFVASFESHVQGMVEVFEDAGERSVGSEKKITCTFFLSIHMVTQWSRKPLRWD